MELEASDEDTGIANVEIDFEEYKPEEVKVSKQANSEDVKRVTFHAEEEEEVLEIAIFTLENLEPKIRFNFEEIMAICNKINTEGHVLEKKVLYFKERGLIRTEIP
jgi:hypothetical protein